MTCDYHPPLTHDEYTVYLIEEQSNPSTDFFVLPAVSSAGLKPVHCGFSDLPSDQDLVGAWVVFVRYVPPAWVKLITAMRHKLRGLAFFMDDDVLDYHASSGMPLRYRSKLIRLSTRRKVG